MLRTLILLSAVALVLLALWFWWARPSGEPAMAAYHDALETHPGSTAAIDAGLREFGEVFADLTRSDTAERMAALYAEEVYFNDTLLTLTTGRAVADYMGATGEKLDSSEVIVHRTLRDGVDVYVRWDMHFATSAFGMKIDSKTIGMTHLRFDDDGRVVLHQDFWDAAGGLYEHLPLIGAVVRTAKKMMK
ncbi:nuclear transport factor 2 family protein [Wenzhouxiangella sp. XN79A]|uniref:nuclear transport factor 2 family protein n=1 Tax=Wenzhouxiangella sp. XN79A TaxID=2724193 RepID=UPI00144AB8AC|nr:nuclear transport factor 2 family protein [Wenzhouxiangella sp. XN79A]NKI34430.1 nuclear transport factor 2 family protein [Wenzhouxiangella sp. XN79A]